MPSLSSPPPIELHNHSKNSLVDDEKNDVLLWIF